MSRGFALAFLIYKAIPLFIIEFLIQIFYEIREVSYMQEDVAVKNPFSLEDYGELVDIKTVKLKDGVSRLENAMYFLEQIKNPHKFRVGDDVVELCFAGEESLSSVLVKHFNRKI